MPRRRGRWAVRRLPRVPPSTRQSAPRACARGRSLRGGTGARGIAAAAADAVRFKLDENLPASSAGVLVSAGHDADPVSGEGLAGALDPDVVPAATAAGRILLTLDLGMGDFRAYPPGSHAGHC